jgi:hypothetical protein
MFWKQLSIRIIGITFFMIILVWSEVFSQESSTVSGKTDLQVKIFPVKNEEDLQPQVVDHRYSPLYWQSPICLPDDPHKTLIGSKGEFLYNWLDKFNTRIEIGLKGENPAASVHQNLFDARIPIIITEKNDNELLLTEEAWARAPEENTTIKEWAPRRVDYLLLKLKNIGSDTKKGQIYLRVENNEKLSLNSEKVLLTETDTAGNNKMIARFDPATGSIEGAGDSLTLYFPEQTLAPGDSFKALVTFYPAVFDIPCNVDSSFKMIYLDYSKSTTVKGLMIIPASLGKAPEELTRAVEFWKHLDLPYDMISIPDPGMQRILDGSIRNLYQAREIKNGYPKSQIGPTMYRGLWAADGAFISEALTYLNRWDEVQVQVEGLLNSEEGPSAGPVFSKIAGLHLWMLWREAQLSGDWKWLEKLWPKVVADVNNIKKFREMTINDSTQANYGLMPIGTGDGGLGWLHREYTNIYGTLFGLKAALSIAEKLNKTELVGWKAEYDDYWKVFDKARNRDKLLDSRGNVYVPVTMYNSGGTVPNADIAGNPAVPLTMVKEQPQLPQRGSWTFLQSIYPGEIYSDNDTLMLGTLHMLDGTVQEGQVLGTAWLAHGIWTYNAGMFAEAHLWLGDSKKAASIMYAFANHASPMLTWVEEQYPVGEQLGELYGGDMPHNWASAELIRLVRNLMIMEKGKELHLLEGMPDSWAEPGKTTGLQNIPTSFGVVDLIVKVDNDGSMAHISLNLKAREIPGKIFIHLEHFEKSIWSVQEGNKYLNPDNNILELNGDEITLNIKFRHDAEQRYVSPEPGFDNVPVYK